MGENGGVKFLHPIRWPRSLVLLKMWKTCWTISTRKWLGFQPTELDIAYEYMKDHLFELQRKIWRRDWSSQLYTHNLSSCEIVAWKKYKPVYYADKFGMYSIKALSSRPCYLRVTFHDKIVSENAGFQFREIMNLYVPFWQRENIDFFAQRINFCICLLTYRK